MSRKINTLTDLTAQTKTRFVVVTHPLFGSYRIRSVTDEVAFQLRIGPWSAETKDKQIQAKRDQDREILAACLVDESGYPILQSEEAEVLDIVDSRVTTWLLAECRSWIGLDGDLGEVIRDTEGN